METIDDFAEVLANKVEEMELDISNLDMSAVNNIMKLLGANQ